MIRILFTFIFFITSGTKSYADDFSFFYHFDKKKDASPLLNALKLESVEQFHLYTEHDLLVIGYNMEQAERPTIVDSQSSIYANPVYDIAIRVKLTEDTWSLFVQNNGILLDKQHEQLTVAKFSKVAMLYFRNQQIVGIAIELAGLNKPEGPIQIQVKEKWYQLDTYSQDEWLWLGKNLPRSAWEKLSGNNVCIYWDNVQWLGDYYLESNKVWLKLVGNDCSERNLMQLPFWLAMLKTKCDLSHQAKEIVLQLLRYANQNKGAFPQKEKLALFELLGYSKREQVSNSEIWVYFGRGFTDSDAAAFSLPLLIRRRSNDFLEVWKSDMGIDRYKGSWKNAHEWMKEYLVYSQIHERYHKRMLDRAKALDKLYPDFKWHLEEN